MWIEVVLCGILVVLTVIIINQSNMLADKAKLIAYLKCRIGIYKEIYEEPMSMNEAEWWEG